MKALLPMALLLVGCVSNPNVTVTTPDGGSVKLSTGTNFMAEVDEQVSEVEGGGFHLRHMVKRQDATRVPIAAIQAVVSYGVAKWAAHTQDLKTTTDGAATLKGTKDPNVIPLDPNVIPKDPNHIPLDPNVIPH